MCPYSEITCKSCMVFMARFDGVHAFGYNSAGSEAIWMKSGTLSKGHIAVTCLITLNHPSPAAMSLMYSCEIIVGENTM